MSGRCWRSERVVHPQQATRARRQVAHASPGGSDHRAPGTRARAGGKTESSELDANRDWLARDNNRGIHAALAEGRELAA
jgi:hypothetical protein